MTIKKQRSEYDFYPTPSEVIQKLLTNYTIQLGSSVLEPCCGKGIIIQHLLNITGNITGVEIEEQRAISCTNDFPQATIVHDDFLQKRFWRY